MSYVYQFGNTWEDFGKKKKYLSVMLQVVNSQTKTKLHLSSCYLPVVVQAKGSVAAGQSALATRCPTSRTPGGG